MKDNTGRCEHGGDASRGRKRVLLVDDHPIVRQGLAKLVNDEQDLFVCGEAGDEPETLALLASAHPHVVLMDISLRRGNGIDLTRTLLRMHPSLPVLMLSMHDDPAYVRRALAAGACGYVTKQDNPETLLAAIREALAGKKCEARNPKSETNPKSGKQKTDERGPKRLLSPF